jgi:hypothetical protein
MKVRTARSNACIRNSCLVSAVFVTSLTAPIPVSSAPDAQSSFSAPCSRSEEFASANRSLVLAKHQIVTQNYKNASQTLERSINLIDKYTDSRVFAAGQTTLDDTGMHLSLAFFYELHGKIKKSVKLKIRLLEEAIESCKTEPAIISQALKKKYTYKTLPAH